MSAAYCALALISALAGGFFLLGATLGLLPTLASLLAALAAFAGANALAVLI